MNGITPQHIQDLIQTMRKKGLAEGKEQYDLYTAYAPVH
ncbi:hypothetical protein ACKE5C_09025 [Aneurinibacillus thermoaerophilus]|uniref:Uncharacterized protein n=1 Tax=Aneurinibacillus thermoaerophilus TaxID=143495 RepID=A0ABX8YHE4_ANETH|nr:hypothetical protein K3F53_08925 [Aneurinibacillus thermoaerophilus]